MTDVLTVWTETADRVMVGASADDAVLLDVFALAVDRGVPVRIYPGGISMSLSRLVAIQALANGMNYEVRWELSLSGAWADLFLVDCDLAALLDDDVPPAWLRAGSEWHRS